MLIVGCGDVGRRLALRAGARGGSPICVVRTAQSAARLRELGLTAHAVDLDLDAATMGGLAPPQALFYLAPPPPRGQTDPRIAHLLRALPGSGETRIVYISTTGVYGDCAGEWVDERRPPNPMVDRARRRLDAERRLRRWRDATGGELVILRVAGIYGPDKLPLERLRRQEPMIAAARASWTNRIHLEDLVTVCEAAMDRGIDGAVYNVSDGRPGNMREYLDAVADRFGLPRAPLIPPDRAHAQLSPGMLSYLGESRRLDNRRMLDELGVTLKFPDLAAGLDACEAH